MLINRDFTVTLKMNKKQGCRACHTAKGLMIIPFYFKMTAKKI